MARAVATVLIIFVVLFGFVFLISRLTGMMRGQSAAVGKILAAVIIAVAAYTLFGQGFLFGYLE